MEERTLFDRFHEALDIEPRPGAYERLRTEITRQPVALRRGPVFRMRFSKMALRTAAALVAVLIAIALIATFIAVHNHPVGEVPAHPDQNLQAYRTMIDHDYNAMNATTSNHCNTIQDADCAGAIVPIKAALQKWIDDMQAFPNTPVQLKPVESILRAHLTDVIRDFDAVIAFQKSGDDAGFNLAVKHAVYERAWLDPASFTLEGNYRSIAASARGAVEGAKASVKGCLGYTPGPTDVACNRLINYETCPGAQRLGCEDDVETVESQIELFLIGMAQNPAPSSQASDYAQIQTDLVHADAGAIALHDAILHGTSGDISIAQTALLKGMEDANRDLSTF